MSRTLLAPDNFRVVVHVTEPMFALRYQEPERHAKEMQSRANEVVAAIRRHVDGICGVEVQCDRAAVCEHCGYNWTETSADYNGGCCDLDCAEEDARIAKAVSP